MKRHFRQNVSAANARSVVAMLIAGATPERRAAFTAEELARSYRVPVKEIERMLSGEAAA
jgi:hypothetical protein